MTLQYEVFDQIVGEVSAHSLSVDIGLVEGWVRDAWQQCMRERTWSFLRRKYAIVIPAPYSTGTVAVDPSSQTVTFTGATLTTSMIGRQFRLSDDEPIHEILSVDVTANTALIHPAPAYLTATATGRSYKIFTCYLTPPNDFLAWLSIANVERRKRLVLHVNQEMLDVCDSKRIRTGFPRCISGIDWSRSYGGRVYSVIQVNGTGQSPIAGGSYTGQSDAVYVVKITSTGAVDSATFSAYRDSTLLINGTTSSDPDGTLLSGGVQLRWPSGTYEDEDIFIIRVSSESQPVLPRYELYPHPDQAITLQALYSAWHPEIDDPSFVLPRPFTPDVLKIGALSRMARYPGTRDKPNPYSQIGRASNFEDELTRPGGLLMQLAATDDMIITQSINDGFDVVGEESLPWMGMGVIGQTEDNPGLYLQAGIYG